jgi:hypothetical protein
MSIGHTPPLFLVRLYIRFSVFWPFFGKQFFVIGKKNIRGGSGDALEGSSAALFPNQ